MRRYLLKIRSKIWSGLSIYIKLGIILMTTAVISVSSGSILGWIIMSKLEYFNEKPVFLFTIMHIGITNLITASCILLLVDIYFFRRIYGLNRSLKKIMYKKDLSVRLKINGNDEISSLSAGINDMLKYLQESKEEEMNPKPLFHKHH
jgi:methyl-accepting chemotaxis protein